MGGSAEAGVSAVMLLPPRRSPRFALSAENTMDNPDPVEKKVGAPPADDRREEEKTDVEFSSK